MERLSSFLKGVVFLFLGVILFLSFISFDPYDLGFLVSPPNKIIHNFIGRTGAYLGFSFFFLFGYAAYLFPLFFITFSFNNFSFLKISPLTQKRTVITLSFLLLLVFLSSLFGIFFSQDEEIFSSAGLIGYFISPLLKNYLGFYGSFIALVFLIIATSTIIFGVYLLGIFYYLKKIVINLADYFKLIGKSLWQYRKTLFLKKNKRIFPQKVIKPSPTFKPQIKIYEPTSLQKSASPPKSKETVPLNKSFTVETKKPAPVNREAFPSPGINKLSDFSDYRLPSPSLLKFNLSGDYQKGESDIHSSIKNLENTFYDFGIEVKVVSVQKGPAVTQYEILPQAGVKLQKISSLADDIALSMKSAGVRIVAPLPGRGTVGIEVPNTKKHIVYLREVLEDSKFLHSPSLLTLAIGKDVSGEPVVADLKEMPHLLIAGSTGAGKTVCVNSLISSVLFKARPDEVKFVLIDPKMVELAPFSGIAHLLFPIISEPKKAFLALAWCVEEMEKRYRILAREGVRNINLYNKEKSREEKLPFIVVVVDELADLMAIARESIETSIQRLAQLSRAVGIHLILATQRPSVDVITGVIKANFPARISFKVSSRVDSRTVLDIIGAEKLLGKGDLLFLKPGQLKPIRAQGCFLEDEDIVKLTDFIRAQSAPQYKEELLKEQKTWKVSQEDELFEEAVRIVLEAHQASASILQRRLRVGYTRAARLLDLMEEKGIVGPFCGSKARDILVEPEEYLQKIKSQ